MWLSKRVSKNINNAQSSAEQAKLTLSDQNGGETNGSATTRNIATYAPYGYCYCSPAGQDVFTVAAPNVLAMLGVKMPVEALSAGEVKISSKGGASIVLKNDGSVIINGLVINKEGEIENG